MSKGYKISNQHNPHFVTFTTVGWVDIFTRQQCKNVILDSFKYCVINKGLKVHAFVIMSSHIHAILRADKQGPGLSSIIRDFKKYTSKKIIKWTLGSKFESRSDWLEIIYRYHAKYNSRNTEYQLWQQDNRPMEVIHPRFTRQKIGYIPLNPIVAGIVDNEAEYLYRSARNYAGRKDFILDVELIDFGSEEGYIF